MPVQVEQFSHLVLRVADIDASLGFYRDFLGLDVAFEKKPEDFPAGVPAVHAVGIRCGAFMLELTKDPRRSGAVETKGAPVMAFGVKDIHATHSAILEAGLEPLMPPTEMMPGIFMIFLADPDGRTVELVQFPDGATSSVEYTVSGGA